MTRKELKTELIIYSQLIKNYFIIIVTSCGFLKLQLNSLFIWFMYILDSERTDEYVDF